MQCQPRRYARITFADDGKGEKETIHSGHFMVSEFEAEAQDDEFEVAVPVPERNASSVPQGNELQVFQKTTTNLQTGHLAIETSLTKLFQCMSLAYRQKLTSPKWNRFKGIRLRWKDKIRLNNVIWRCWHMQFIKKQNTLICQFASPLDEGIHNKPEAVVLEGKYWKRRLAAVTAEYKKWRMFYRNKIMGWAGKDYSYIDPDLLEWQSGNADGASYQQMMVDEDYMELMSDTLFSTISSNQPFAFPDIREITRGASLADFIQPSLVQLQPNLDDFMDTLEPLQEFFSSKLPPVPEDCAVADATYRALPESSPPPPPPAPVISQNSAAQSMSYSYDKPKTAFYGVLQDNVDNGSQVTKYYTDSQNIKTSRMYLPNKGDVYSYGKGSVSSKDAGSSESYGSNVLGTYRAPAPPAAVGPTQTFAYQQYVKGEASSSSGQLYSRSPQNYDLASNQSEVTSHKIFERSASLPSVVREDVFAVPKVQLKSKHRSRSGSSLLTGKARQHPPPLLTSNSDSNLNLQKSALLAQLLTTTPVSVYNLSSGKPSLLPSTSGTSAKTGQVPILPMPSSTKSALLITSAILPSSQGYVSVTPGAGMSSMDPGPKSPTESKKNLMTSPPATSPQSLYDPLSPKRPTQDVPERNKTPPHNPEHRRACHINAEQKRRYNIRNGFEVLHSLIPSLQINPSAKLSKAAMLQKGADYIRQLQAERSQVKDEVESLRYQIECLNSAINNCQSLLPATGAPVSRHRTNKINQMFDDLVRQRTQDNWKFWVFSVLFESLLSSFNCSVSTASYEDLYRSTLMWVEQHCSLVNLRPAVLNSLRGLSTSTDILTEPQKLPEEARNAVSTKRSS